MSVSHEYNQWQVEKNSKYTTYGVISNLVMVTSSAVSLGVGIMRQKEQIFCRKGKENRSLPSSFSENLSSQKT